MPITFLSTGGKVVEVTGTGVVTVNTWGLSRIRWVAAATAGQGDTCVVTDTAGNVIFESIATGADFSDEVELSKVPLFQGIIITTLANGHLYFYLR